MTAPVSVTGSLGGFYIVDYIYFTYLHKKI